MSKLTKTEISDLDKWIEQLKECKPLEECQVKVLCEKVFQKINIIFNIILGQRNIKSRAKCPTSEGPSYSLWRHSWSIFRFS